MTSVASQDVSVSSRPTDREEPHRGKSQGHIPPSYFWGFCVLSGLLGGPTFAHVVRGVQWETGLVGQLPSFCFGTWPLAWIALIPYFSTLYLEEQRRWIWGTLLFGFLWHLLSLVWLATLIPFNPFIPFGVLLLPLALAGFTLIFAGAVRSLSRRCSPSWWPAITASAWVGVEYARTLGPFAFPWNFLGHSQAIGNSWGSQVADLSGVSAVSWPIAYVNAAGALCLAQFVAKKRNWRVPARQPQYAVILTIAIALLVGQFGVYPVMVQRVCNCKRAHELKIAALQPNIPQVEKLRFYTATDPDEANLLDERMTRHTLALIEQTCGTTSLPLDLLVLPESAFNSNYFVYDRALHRELERLSRTSSVDILFGADRREPVTAYTARLMTPFSGHSERKLPQLAVCANADGTTYPCEDQPMVSTVAAYFVNSQTGLTSTVYDKIRLVPFGETAPVFDKIPYFQEWVLMVGSYARGTEYTLFHTRDASIGVMICFESTFADLARSYAQRGAQMLCIITNDGWYDKNHLQTKEDFWRSSTAPSSIGSRCAALWSGASRRVFSLPPLVPLLDKGPIQHLAHAVFRAIETRRPVVRAANTGISAVITPDGTIQKWLPWRQTGKIVATVEICHDAPRTLAVRFGDWLGQLCFTILIAAVLLTVGDAIARWRPRQPSAAA